MSNADRRNAYYNRLDKYIMAHPAAWHQLHCWRKLQTALRRKENKS